MLPPSLTQLGLRSSTAVQRVLPPTLLKPTLDGFDGSVHRVDASAPVVGGMLADRDWSGYLDKIQGLRNRSVDVQTIGKVEGHPFDVIRLPSTVQPPKLKVMITGGVHGSESSGPAAALMLVEHLLAHPELRRHVQVTVMPMVCAYGYINAKRNNHDDKNVNREVSDDDNVPEEVKLMRSVMKSDPVHLSVDLHRSKANGGKSFFALQRQADRVLGKAMARFSLRHPVLSRTTQLYEMFSPGVFKSRNTGTVKDYMALLGTLWSYTLEAPTHAAYLEQVLGSVDLCLELMKAALHENSKGRPRTLL